MNNQTAALGARVGNYRWVICALLFVCTTINYIDRNALGVLKPILQGELGWTEVDYGWIVFAFVFAYAAFPSVIGVIIDRIGVKKSLAIALIVWSLAAAGHGLVATVIGFALMRFLLGVAEAANFPASIKAVAMWFPQKERAFATGIFNSGTSVGVIAAPVTVYLAAAVGWQYAFFVLGIVGFFWLYFWQRSFQPPEQHPKVGAAELEYIRAGQPAVQESVKLPWSAPDLALPHRQIPHRSRVVVLPVLAA
jgi:MFS transporter, ACS family, hexuronate transporter